MWIVCVCLQVYICITMTNASHPYICIGDTSSSTTLAEALVDKQRSAMSKKKIITYYIVYIIIILYTI